jgi:hypothetical protein
MREHLTSAFLPALAHPPTCPCTASAAASQNQALRSISGRSLGCCTACSPTLPSGTELRGAGGEQRGGLGGDNGVTWVRGGGWVGGREGVLHRLQPHAAIGHRAARCGGEAKREMSGSSGMSGMTRDMKP